MLKYRRVIIPEVLCIHSSTSNIHYFSYGGFFKKEIFQSENKCKFNIFFEFKPKKYFADLIEEFKYSIKYSDSIFLEDASDPDRILLLYKKNAGILKLYMQVFSFKNSIHFYVNKPYYTIFKFRVENVLPPGIHLRDLTYLKLLLNDFLSLHASSFASDDVGYLILAPPNTGKSVTVTKLARDGFKVLSEDISVVNLRDLSLYAVPYTTTLYHKTSKLEYLAPLDYYIPHHYQPFGEVFIKNLISKSKLKKIFILEYGKPEILVEEEKAKALVSLINLTKSEFSLRSNLVMDAILYNYGFDLEQIEYTKFSKLIEKIDIVRIRANSPMKYFDAIKKEVTN
jgi:hypothetical protein